MRYLKELDPPNPVLAFPVNCVIHVHVTHLYLTDDSMYSGNGQRCYHCRVNGLTLTTMTCLSMMHLS